MSSGSAFFPMTREIQRQSRRDDDPRCLLPESPSSRFNINFCRLISSHALLQKPAPVPSVIAVEGRIRLSRRAAGYPFLKRDDPLPARMLRINAPIRRDMRSFPPYLSMNDYTGLASALLAGTGIGDFPPVVRSLSY